MTTGTGDQTEKNLPNSGVIVRSRDANGSRREIRDFEWKLRAVDGACGRRGETDCANDSRTIDVPNPSWVVDTPIRV